MITAINSATSFKAVYTEGGAPLTAAQERTLKQIKSVVNKEAPFDNFLVSPLGTNQVELYKGNVNRRKVNGKESYTFDSYGAIDIGTYDINHPFKMQDVDLAIEKQNKNQMKSTLIGGAYMLALFAGFLMLARGYSAKPKNVEKVTDTIATKVDTLKSAEILKP